MSSEFIGQEVQVSLSDELVRQPVAFVLEDRQYRIIEITESWQEYGHEPDPRRRHRWWQRRHRNWYRVSTEEGEAFELFYERGATGKHPERRKWFVFRRLSN